MKSLNSKCLSQLHKREPIQWLTGSIVAAKILKITQDWIKKYQPKICRAPSLGLIRIGQDPASIRYMQKKIEACRNVGINSHLFIFNEMDDYDQIKKCIKEHAKSSGIDGLILQLPVPMRFSDKASELINLIPVNKDVDGLGRAQQMQLLSGGKMLIPCTAIGVISLLHYYNIPLMGKNIVLIGRSLLVGKPLISLLLQENASVTILHSFSEDISTHLKTADVVIVAIGQAQKIQACGMRPGATIIDVGISAIDKKLLGDVSIDHFPKTANVTPVPGGVGPITVANLMLNCARACAFQHNLEPPAYL